ncbi:MAG: alpha/beta hydrolase [Acidimicrobiales bacterium]|nr:alpha/beta hydrolase [Acidimicrobiales bacterium]
MASTRSASALYLTRLRQLLGRAPIDLPPPVAPPLPPGRVLSLPGRGDTFIRELEGPTDRPPLLFLHGWTASADLNWYGAFDRFDGVRRVIAVDHRGHGRGMRTPEPFRLTDCADDAAAVLDVLGIDQAIAVGYSMGGPISLLLARRHRARVSGLVLAATGLQFSSTRAERLRWKGIALLELGVRAGWGDRLVARLADDLARVDDAFAPHSAWLASEFTRTHPRLLRQAGAELGRFDARPWAGQLAVPAAVVITEGDSLVPYARQRALAALLGAHLQPLPGADHDVPITDVDAFSGALAAGVEAVDPRVAAGERDGEPVAGEARLREVG